MARHHHPQLANTIIDQTTGRALEYRHLIQQPHTRSFWVQSFINELGRLAQGKNNNNTGTNTIKFVNYNTIPPDRKSTITYGRLVVDHKTHKAEPHRTRLTVGGNHINYPGPVSTPTADITTAKLLLNSTISTPNARFMTADIGNFYLDTPMPRPEYLFLPVSIIPQHIMTTYNLHDLTHNNKIYIQINKGMYGLPQAGKLAHDQLIDHLLPHGYYPCRHTPGLWRHHWRPIIFSLVVDDFGIKYVGRDHAIHFVQALQSHYPKVTVDWTGSLYCGITIRWDYQRKHVDLSMPSYIKDTLTKYQHPAPNKPQHAPHKWSTPSYGTKIQLAPPPDASDLLSDSQTKRIQQILGTLLYYARAIDCTLLVALGSIAQQQSRCTQSTLAAITQLLDYCHTHPEATVCYTASDMVLKI